jgi:hypothetical protein
VLVFGVTLCHRQIARGGSAISRQRRQIAGLRARVALVRALKADRGALLALERRAPTDLTAGLVLSRIEDVRGVAIAGGLITIGGRLVAVRARLVLLTARPITIGQRLPALGECLLAVRRSLHSLPDGCGDAAGVVRAAPRLRAAIRLVASSPAGDVRRQGRWRRDRPVAES